MVLRHGLSLSTSTWTDRQVPHPMLSRLTDRTGDSQHTTGMLCLKMVAHGGFAVSARCRNTSMLTALTTCLVSSASGRFLSMPYTDCWANSRHRWVWPARRLRLTDCISRKNFSLSHSSPTGLWIAYSERKHSTLRKHSLTMPTTISGRWSPSSTHNARWRLGIRLKLARQATLLSSKICATDCTPLSATYYSYAIARTMISSTQESACRTTLFTRHFGTMTRLCSIDCTTTISIVVTTSSGIPRLWRNCLVLLRPPACLYVPKT